MRAVCYEGRYTVHVETVKDPEILNPRDAIIKVTSTAICGSDLHLYHGLVPTMQAGDILGHEFMGIVVEVGSGVRNLRPGDRVVVPFAIACGNCCPCARQEFSLCDNSNPNGYMLEKLNGYTTAALFGYSHMYGGYAGGQAEFVRVPFADVGPIKIESDIPDEKVLFLSDIFPTGYMAAENCNIKPGQTVAVWGCGPVGQFAIRSAFLLGAGRVFAIDKIPERLQMAQSAGAIAISSEDDVLELLREATGGQGPDACIDAVGMEAHGSAYDAIKQTARLETDRPFALRQAMRACRKGGTLSISGVYAGIVDKLPVGAAFAKGLTIKMGQTHVQRYLKPLLDRIERNDIDPSFVITHKFPLSDAEEAYRTFSEKSNNCIKVVLKPADYAVAA
jgi:threonine dehydrogenase-like Zn-dependent dehydrogenase